MSKERGARQAEKHVEKRDEKITWERIPTRRGGHHSEKGKWIGLKKRT